MILLTVITNEGHCSVSQQYMLLDQGLDPQKALDAGVGFRWLNPTIRSSKSLFSCCLIRKVPKSVGAKDIDIKSTNKHISVYLELHQTVLPLSWSHNFSEHFNSTKCNGFFLPKL